jgi:hypothetical protein
MAAVRRRAEKNGHWQHRNQEGLDFASDGVL